jgi:photosystem II stability/assembly factor-like uncharacterized protein
MGFLWWFGRRRISLAFTAALVAAVLGWAGLAAAARADDTSILMPLAERSILVAGAKAGDRLVVVGERGHVLLSDDGGQSWRQRQVPTRSLLTAVTFADANTGWAVGHDAVILRTVDAGEHWERVHYAPELDQPLLDILFRNPDHGFAIGAYGYFLVTTDGGVSWDERRVSEEDEWHLNRLTSSADGHLYIAAEAGTLYHSENGGDSWAKLPLPYEGSMFGVLPLDGEKLLAYGLRGHLFRSEDAGQNWAEVPTGTQASLSDAVRLPDGRIVIGGQAGTLLVSDDDGRTVRLHRQPDRQAIAALLVGSQKTIITLGEGGIKRIPIDFKINRAAALAPSH